MKVILNIDKATKRYGGLMANEDISFAVYEGEILGIVGPNGAGKTTLFNSISCAERLTRGRIVFDDVDISNKKAHQANKLGIGRTFQIPQSLNDMTVFQNVLVAALSHQKELEAASVKANEVIAMCGLEKYRDCLASILNVAQKKRLEITRALATNPKLLLLDEAMAGLTATERKESLDLIRKINAQGITILTIEHNMDVVMKVSDRVVVLTSGKVLKIGTPEEITQDEDVISAYLGKDKHAGS